MFLVLSHGDSAISRTLLSDALFEAEEQAEKLR